MKRITLLATAFLLGVSLQAQTLNGEFANSAPSVQERQPQTAEKGNVRLVPTSKYNTKPEEAVNFMTRSARHVQVKNMKAEAKEQQRISPIASYPDDAWIQGVFDSRYKDAVEGYELGQVLSFYANGNTHFYKEYDGKQLAYGAPGTQLSYVCDGLKWYAIDGNHVDVYDAKTGEKIKSTDTSVGSAARGDAYSPWTKKIYVMNWDGLVEMDPNDFSSMVLGSTEGFTMAVAAAPDGIYYVTYDGKLKKFDLDTKTNTTVMDDVKPTDTSTGKKVSWANAGAALAYDNASGKFYFSFNDNKSYSKIAVINPKAGTSDLLINTPGQGFMMAGLYIPYVAPGVPASPTGIGYTNGKLSFTAPTMVFDSSAELSKTLTVYITVDNGDATSFSVNPGENVSHDLVLDNGNHSLIIQVANEAGKSQPRLLKTFVGEDVPSKPQNLTLDTNDGNNLNLSWEAPKEGVNGGPIPDEQINYDIVRYPDAVSVATDYKNTTFSEPIPAVHQRYYYVVTAKNGSNAGLSAESNHVPAGNTWYPPYTEEFRTQADFDFFSVIDGNGDGQTWAYLQPLGDESFGEAYLYGNGVTNPETSTVATLDNDYLVSPAIRLEAGNDYKLSFTTGEQWLLNETMRVMLGTSDDTTSITQTIIPTFIVPVNGSKEAIFNVPSTGDYHLFIHANTVGNSVNIVIDSLAVSCYANFEGPDSVGNLTATADALGALGNTLSFTTPSTTYKGGSLSAISYINVYRDGETKPVHKFTYPATGAKLTWRDNDVAQGSHTYRVVPFNDKGQGKEALVTNWVGVDIPANVANVKAVMDENYNAVLTWDKVTATGVHGGYVDPDDVRYVLKRYNEYNFDDHWEVVADTTSELTATDATLSSETQAYHNYAVVATNATGANDGTMTGIVLGKPYDKPYSESFKNGYVTFDPWTLYTNSYNYAWKNITASGVTVTPYDKDNGMMQFGYKDEESNKLIISGPRVSLRGSTAPELSFYMWHGFEAEEGELTLDLFTNYQDEGWTLHKAILDYNNGTEGWQRYSMPLRTDARDIQIAFAATATAPVAAIYIDNIKIGEGVEKDLSIENFTMEKRIERGATATAVVTLSNNGMLKAENYKVRLLRDGAVYAETTGREMNENQLESYTFSIPTTVEDASKQYTFQATVEYEGDACANNDSSATVRLIVHGSVLPPAENLTGSKQGHSVKLTWNKPAATRIQDNVTDGFDDYDAFIFEGIGDWTTYDGDGTPTASFNASYTNRNAAMAWQVFNPTKAGFNLEKFDVLKPHSGSQYLACWATSDGSTTVLPNDDWLISSDVRGGTDLDFYARVPNDGVDANVFELLYTTVNSTNAEDYVAFNRDSIGGTTEWTHFQYTLPEDATHFAIRGCTNSTNYLVMFLDDLTYTPLNSSYTDVSLTGYNIYKNGQLLGNVGSDVTTYTDDNSSAKGDSYTVTAVYEEGESNGTTPYVSPDDATGITTSQNATSSVMGGKGFIKVLTANETVRVFNASGKLLAKLNPGNNAMVSLPAGVYIVCGEGHAVKVTVR